MPGGGTRPTDGFKCIVKATAYDCTHSAACERLLQARPKEKLLLQEFSTYPKQTTARVACVAICRRRSENFHPFFKARIQETYLKGKRGRRMELQN